jgi:hypothetical protein
MRSRGDANLEIIAIRELFEVRLIGDGQAK